MYRQNVAGREQVCQTCGADFVRDCAVEMHLDISREDFMRTSTGKCRGPESASRSNTGLNSYRKNPFVWTHCLGDHHKRLVKRKSSPTCWVYYWAYGLPYCQRLRVIVHKARYFQCLALHQGGSTVSTVRSLNGCEPCRKRSTVTHHWQTCHGEDRSYTS